MSSDIDEEKLLVLKRLWSFWVWHMFYKGRKFAELESLDMLHCPEFMAAAKPFADSLFQMEGE